MSMSIDELKEWMQEKFNENKEDHIALQKRVDNTNGRVKSLEIWKATLIGAWAVVAMILIPLVATYLKGVANNIIPNSQYLVSK